MKKILFFLTFFIISLLGINCNENNIDQDEKVKVGAILPLTGNISFIGKSIFNGLKLAEIENEEIIEVIYEDSKGIPKDAISIYNKLKLQQKINIFIPALSSTTNALLPVSDKENDILFATCVSSSKITQKSDNLFRLFVNADKDARLMAKYSIDSLNFKNFYIFYINDDFGVDYKEVFTDEVKKNEGKIIGTSSFNRGDNDFLDILNQLKSKNEDIDAVYLLGYDNNMGLFLKQYIEQQINLPVLSIATIAQPNVSEMLNEYDKQFKIYYTNTLLYNKLNKSEITEKFIENYTKQYNEKPNYFAAFAYDLLNIIINCKKTQNKRECLLKSVHNGVMGKIQFDRYGDADFPMIIESY